jgi:hypothetical protein
MYSRKIFSDSNEMALIYMDVNPGIPGGLEFYTTIAHEFQHLINYSIRMEQQDSLNTGIPASSQDVWLDEGLSAAAEFIYSKGPIASKIQYFNADRNGTFARGNTFFKWDGDYDEYASVYLFFHWLGIQAGDDHGIYRDIAHASDRDYRAVTGAAAKWLGPQFASWEALLGTWLLANHINAPDGFLGYRKQILTRINTIDDPSISLAPGEGVFSFLDGTGFDEPSGSQKDGAPHIRYSGVTRLGKLINTGEDPQYRGGYRLLTFNANEQNAGPTETSPLTGKKDPSVTSIPKQVESFRGPYPIDILPAFPE